MIAVKVLMKLDRSPLERVPVALHLDAEDRTTPAVPTDREGVARFDLPSAMGKVLVDGVERYQGRLDEQILIALWSITQGGEDALAASGVFPSGSNAYPDMQRQTLRVNGRDVETDAEGYLVDPAQWSEDFARVLAERECLVLTDAHWEVIRYLRQRFAATSTQATVRDMVRHFARVWGAESGSSRALHRLFPRGGPQKQGNRLAGLLRTKGEH